MCDVWVEKNKIKEMVRRIEKQKSLYFNPNSSNSLITCRPSCIYCKLLWIKTYLKASVLIYCSFLHPSAPPPENI